MSTTRLPGLAAVLTALGLWSASALAGEGYAAVENAAKTRIEGDLLAGDDIRIEVPLTVGAEPRFSITLTGAKPNQPITFTTAKLTDPDGAEVPGAAVSPPRFSSGRVTYKVQGGIAARSGLHTLFVRTNAKIRVRLTVKLVVVRPERIPIAGDESVAPVRLDLMPNDETRVRVKRVSGAAPRIAQYKLPSGTSVVPPQKLTSKGSKTGWLRAVQPGIHEYAIGYQADPPAGAWEGTIDVRPPQPLQRVTLRLRNRPGVPVSVLAPDRFLNVTFGSTPVGLASDGSRILVTTEAVVGTGRELRGQLFDIELQPLTPQATYTVLTAPVDFSPGESLQGHRVLWLSPYYHLAFGSVSGREVAIARVRADLLRDGFAQVVTSATDPANDFFLVTNGPKVCVGVPVKPTGHVVNLLDATDYGVRSTASVGGAAYPQSAGAGAAWRETDQVYELWSADTLAYVGPSDLHRVLYDARWVAQTTDVRPVADPLATETMPSAVTVEPFTGVTILHYVVADNPPPDLNYSGSGRLHRRLFRPDGTELVLKDGDKVIEDSHFAFPGTQRDRPASCIVGNYLFVGYVTPAGPTVERCEMIVTRP